MSATTRPCPRCGESLDSETLGSEHVEACRGCAGLWVDGEVLRRLAAAQTKEPERPTSTPPLATRGAMRCPTCAGAALVARCEDEIEVDVCPRCGGVYLDHGELERLGAGAASRGATRNEVWLQIVQTLGHWFG